MLESLFNKKNLKDTLAQIIPKKIYLEQGKEIKQKTLISTFA